LIALLTVPFVTGHVTVAEFGSVDLVTNVVNLVLPVTSLSVAEAVLRFGMSQSQVMRRVLSSGLAVGVLGCAIAAAGWFFVRYVTFGELFWVGYFLLSAQTIRDVGSAYLRAADEIRLLVVGGLVQSLCYAAAAVILMGALPWALSGYLMALCLSNLPLPCLCLWVAFRRGDLSLLDASPALARDMLRYSVPLVPNALLWWAVTSVSRFYLALDSGAEAVGIYGVAVRVSTILMAGSSVFLQAWQLSAIEQQDAVDGRVFEGSVFGVLSGLLILLSSFILVILKSALERFFEAPYFPAWRVVPPLLLGGIFLTLSSFVGTRYKVQMTTVRALWTSLVGALVAFAMSAALIPWLGAVGAALATCLGYGALWLLRIVDLGLPAMSVRETRLLTASFTMLIVQMFGLYLAPVRDFEVLLQVAFFGLLVLMNAGFVWPVVSLLGRVARGFFS